MYLNKCVKFLFEFQLLGTVGRFQALSEQAQLLLYSVLLVVHSLSRISSLGLLNLRIEWIKIQERWQQRSWLKKIWTILTPSLNSKR